VNALFETRLRARKLFTDLNSMPDSMKANTENPGKLRERNWTAVVNKTIEK